MAIIKKLYPLHKSDGKEKATSFENILASLPNNVQKEVEKYGIKSFEDLIGFMLESGIDPLKMMKLTEERHMSGDFKLEDVMLDDEFFDEDEEFEDEDEDEDDEDGYWLDDEAYLLGMELPKTKFIGKSKREFHIRIKLNNAPVQVWRELVVPSNITLELLAYVLLQAMGWEHEHLFQFIGKKNVYYVNTQRIKEEEEGGFMSFFTRSQYRNSDKTSLEMVLQPKGERMQFEYDFGDSWKHDLWVKGSRDYDPDEEPTIKLLKAQGDCPPEDCGGVWGYADLIELNKKKRKTAEDKERLEWFGIAKNFDPEICDLEWLQENVEELWERIQEEM